MRNKIPWFFIFASSVESTHMHKFCYTQKCFTLLLIRVWAKLKAKKYMLNILANIFLLWISPCFLPLLNAFRSGLLYEKMKQEFSVTLSSKWSIKALDFVFTYPIFRNNKGSYRVTGSYEKKGVRVRSVEVVYRVYADCVQTEKSLSR